MNAAISKIALGLIVLQLAASMGQAGVISVNMLGEPFVYVGTAAAGVVHVGSWNEYYGATLLSLRDDSGAATAVSFSTAQNASGSDNGGAAIAGDPGSNAMLDGHFYVIPGETFGDIIFSNIEYASYDLYVYYNSQALTNNYQTFKIEQTNMTKIGSELTSTQDTGFVESNGSNDANYVVFHGLSLSTITLSANADLGGYAYVNGLQLVEIPEPTTLGLLLAGVVFVTTKRRKY